MFATVLACVCVVYSAATAVEPPEQDLPRLASDISAYLGHGGNRDHLGPDFEQGLVTRLTGDPHTAKALLFPFVKSPDAYLNLSGEDQRRARCALRLYALSSEDGKNVAREHLRVSLGASWDVDRVWGPLDTEEKKLAMRKRESVFGLRTTILQTFADSNDERIVPEAIRLLTVRDSGIRSRVLSSYFEQVLPKNDAALRAVKRELGDKKSPAYRHQELNRIVAAAEEEREVPPSNEESPNSTQPSNRAPPQPHGSRKPPSSGLSMR